jgi:hypothetical protein
MRFSIFAACAALTLLSACGTYTTGSVQKAPGAAETAAAGKPASQIIVTENDITDRKYRSLGEISVTVSKFSMFDSDPTHAKVDEALREKAADLGADAVVLARYGAIVVGSFSWGQMDGSGRAVIFEK